ncbi:MAG: sialidase family protein [Gemmatimonadetes bacterium]|nr:sialidase family protein [Gemmatimonadota bacterium]
MNRLWMSVPRVLAAASLLWLAACASERPSIDLGGVEFSGPPGSAEPNLFAARDGRVLMSWHEPASTGGHALRMAVRTEGAWSEPITVAGGREFFVNWADFPSVVEQADGTWVVHWLEKTARPPYAYHVMVSRSADEGTTWSEPFRPHRDMSATEHGFVSMVTPPTGGVALLWLDGRGTSEGSAGHGGTMSLRFTTLAADGALGEDMLVDGRVCDCCQTAMVMTDTGRLVAAYRDRSEEEIRDIAVSRLEEGAWSEPYHVGNDNWHYSACPVNGPSLASAGETLAIVWYTEGGGDRRVQLAFSPDEGASFAAPVRVDDGDPLGRVDLEMLPDGSVLVVWLEKVGEGGEIRARRVTTAGTADPSWTVSTTSPARRSGFPRLVARESDVVFAWTDASADGGIRVATAAWER